MIADPATIRQFWFQDLEPAAWFRADPALDLSIRDRFFATYQEAAAGRLAAWLDTAQDGLALILLLDQFPRNMFRGSARAFATDDRACAVADNLIARGLDRRLATLERRFVYLPFEHAEDLAQQDRAIALMRAAGDTEGLIWAEKHRDVIRRFGRFPHRNDVLGRPSTAAERAFLAEHPGF